MDSKSVRLPVQRLRTYIVAELSFQIRKLASAIWRTFQGDEARPVRSNFLAGESKRSIGRKGESTTVSKSGRGVAVHPYCWGEGKRSGQC
jgi:hypothetical protein